MLLSEDEMPNLFKTEQDFFDLIKNSSLTVSKIVDKKRHRFLYKGTNIVIDTIKNDGIYIELNGADKTIDKTNNLNDEDEQVTGKF